MKKTIADRIKEIVPNDGKFTATDIAEKLDLPIVYKFNTSSPIATKHLLKLCKEGYLVQWFISNGTKSCTSDACPAFTCYYMRRESYALLNMLLRSKRKIIGHRVI